MLIKPQQQNAAHSIRDSWKALQYFNLYRLIIAMLFVMLIWIDRLHGPLGSYNPLLFTVAAHIYLLLAFCIIFFTQLHTPSYHTQLTVHILLDIIAINLLMYASNGISSGLGTLLIIAIIAVSILQIGKLAILFAATATLLILLQEAYIHFFRPTLSPYYTHAGLLGLTCFITAILGQLLTTRIQQSEELAEQQAVNITHLDMLNEYIIQKMQSGLVVLDDNNQIRLLNQSAEHLLGLHSNVPPQQIKHNTAELLQHVNNWHQGTGKRTIIYRPTNADTDVQASFTRLNPSTEFSILIFLEDVAHIRQHAQHIKISSLGRLSASIAHEIRNPLAAISHASQLLSESTSIPKEDKQLTHIINEHTDRLNKIVENMQHISRRKAAIPEHINISAWLTDFIADLLTQKQLQKTDIYVQTAAQNIVVYMDSSQLYQVLWNLSENALQHSRHQPDKPLIEFQWGVRSRTGRVYLDIIDHGSGIDDKIIPQLFDPFFTTTSYGTGLGLYISRELCEANQASLVLDRNTNQGCRFRIYFADKDKYGYLLS